MTDLRAEWDEYSTEYLIDRRLNGANLPDEVHGVIEELLRSRSALVPPRPVPGDEPGPETKRISSGAAFGLAILYWVLSQPLWIVLSKVWPPEVIQIGKGALLLILIGWAFKGRHRRSSGRATGDEVERASDARR